VSMTVGRRQELAANVAACRALGMTWRETAAELGISYGYARDLYNDPDGSKARARKDACSGYCAECGCRTTGSNGYAKAPDLCYRCQTKRAGIAKRGRGSTVSRILAFCAEQPRRYGEIRDTLDISSDQVGYALNRLVRYGLLERVTRGVYRTIQ
jgi:hypothetical protein